MSGIGDLWFALRAESRTLVADATKAGDQAGSGFAARFKTAFGKQGTGKAVVDGLGLGQGLAIFGGAAVAIGTLTKVMGDAVQAAREDEASQSQLRASLKANIPAWDGNTDAIERVLAARMDLGFSDDEQRQSLTGLVAATHDVSKALDIQRVAMDLARFKGISLAEASQALVKVEGGQYRMLKTLGIQLPKNATAEQALTAVRRVAAGQAADYAQTNEGKLLRSQVKVNEALERLGYIIMPAVTDAALTMANAASDGLERLSSFGENTKREFDDVGKTLKDIGDIQIGGTSRNGIEDYFKRGAAAAKDTNETIRQSYSDLDRGVTTSVENMRGNIAWGTKSINQNLVDMGLASADLADDTDTNTARVTRSFGEMVQSLKSDASSLIDDVYEPAIDKANLAADVEEAAALRRAIASGKLKGQELSDSKQRLLQLSKDADQTRLNLLASGSLTAKETGAWLTALRKKAASESGLAKVKIWELIGAITDLRNKAKGTININVNMGSGGTGARAGGGPVPPGWVGKVGEAGTETLVMYPGGGGYVIPHGASAAAGYAGGSSAGPGMQGSSTWAPQVTIYNPVGHPAEEDVSRTMRRLAALGVGR